jgi:Beta propeller domain
MTMGLERKISSLAMSGLCLSVAACATTTTPETPSAQVEAATAQSKRFGVTNRLSQFASDAAWEGYIGKVSERDATSAYDMPPPPPPSAPPPPPPPAPPSATSESVSATASRASTPSPTNPEITNNQNVGVDEGGIIKQIGPYLLVLQDGRIFTVDTRASMRLSDRLNVYTSVSRGAWYDEMLVQGDRVLVTAYSYAERATVMSVFRVDMTTGKLTRDGSFAVSSQDYYSGSNYATRIVGDKLVFRITSNLASSWQGPQAPSITVRPNENEEGSRRAMPLVKVQNLYRPLLTATNYVAQTIVICQLGNAKTSDLICRSESFIGPRASELLVTTTDAYLWNGAGWYDSYSQVWRQIYRDSAGFMTAQNAKCAGLGPITQNDIRPSVVYKVPLNGATPSVAMTRGQPSSQFALEVQNNRFHMISNWTQDACAMYGFQAPSQLTLTSIPLRQFGTTPRPFDASNVNNLPGVGQPTQVRFMRDWMVYQTPRPSALAPTQSLTPVEANARNTIYATPLARPRETITSGVPYPVTRLQPMAGGMLAIGPIAPNNLGVSWLASSTAFKPASTLTMTGRIESEGRSHAFSSTQLPDDRSLFGLPTVRVDDGQVRSVARSASSNLSFLTMTPTGDLSSVGDIAMSKTDPNSTYRCEVSCIDWYGNSRAVFTGGRIFALLGTEIVEGRLSGSQMGVIGRLDMTGPVEGGSK